MQYVGGKSRSAKHIATVIADMALNHDTIYEPFCGGCGATKELAQRFNTVYASDIHSGLIEMWNVLQVAHFMFGDPLAMFPETITREEYHQIKNSTDSPLKTFVSFGASFGGKEWGGYASKSKRGQDYYKSTRVSILRFAQHWKNVEFTPGGYKEQTYLPGAVIYCDPPYADTTGYKAGAFNSQKFWQWVRDMTHKGHQVFVSEYNAPEDMTCVWQKQVRKSLNVKNRSSKATEKLFIYDPLGIFTS